MHSTTQCYLVQKMFCGIKEQIESALTGISYKIFISIGGDLGIRESRRTHAMSRLQNETGACPREFSTSRKNTGHFQGNLVTAGIG